MRLRLKSSKLLLAAALLLTACGQPQKSAQKTDNKPAGRKVIPETTLTFLGFDGRPVSSIEVELADEQLERSQGLMDVRSMPENEGMLFIFRSPNLPGSIRFIELLLLSSTYPAKRVDSHLISVTR